MTPLGSARTGHVVPRAVVRSRPLKNTKVASTCSTGARPRIPREPVLVRTLKETELPPACDGLAHRGSSTQAALDATQKLRQRCVNRDGCRKHGAVGPPGVVPAPRYRREE